MLEEDRIEEKVCVINDHLCECTLIRIDKSIFYFSSSGACDNALSLFASKVIITKLTSLHSSAAHTSVIESESTSLEIEVSNILFILCI